MRNARLTERRIRDLRTDPDRTSFVWDAGLPGFGVRLSKGGVRAFVLWVRSDGRKRLLTLGRSPEMSLDAARAVANSELNQIERGSADLTARRADAKAAMTVSDGAKWYVETYIPRRQGLGKMSDRTSHEYRRQLKAYIVPAIGYMKIEQVTRQDIEKMLDSIGWDKAAMFTRVRALVRALFNIFQGEGWRREGSNPGTKITTPTERERTRTLSPVEQTAFFVALARLGDDAAARSLQFLYEAGCRLDEARTLRWEFVDGEAELIHLPATKTGAKTITATGAVMAVVNACPKIAGNPHVFAGAGSAPMSAKTIRRKFNQATALAEIVDAKPHDLRRTYITELIDEGVPITTVAALVGHASIQMTARYAKATDSVIRGAGEILAAARRKRQGADVVAIGGRRA